MITTPVFSVYNENLRKNSCVEIRLTETNHIILGLFNEAIWKAGVCRVDYIHLSGKKKIMLQEVEKSKFVEQVSSIEEAQHRYPEYLI